jgi:hypothetical protein
VEHQTLEATFVIGALAGVVASVLALVMLVRWLRGRRNGRPALWAGRAFLCAVGIAGMSTAWLVYERHEKCDRTVSRTLCESPIEWLQR